MQKKLEWTEHKAPPLPIMQGANIIPDSLYLYGVDFMSTDDVKAYFSRYSQIPEDVEQVEGVELFSVQWINDSSCVIKLPTEAQAQKAYVELKLSEARKDDQLPSLYTYVQNVRELEQKVKEKKEHNPDYDDLFAVIDNIPDPMQEAEEVKLEDIVIDPRNHEAGIGYIDVMGFKVPYHKMKNGNQW